MVLPINQQLTLEKAIRLSANSFTEAGLYFGHGTETAIDEASWLILYSVGLSPLAPPDYDRRLSKKEVMACNQLLTQRIESRTPAAYLMGEAWFAGHRFIVDQRALIPRSPLAEFIQDDFFGLTECISAPRILDLCTGSGCIAIACALASPQSEVHASDLSIEALDLAKENVQLHSLQERITLLNGSLFDPVSSRYDLIISNPPYVDALDMASMPAEYDHEPRMGLAAGSDGLDLVRIMLREAADYLTDQGYLIVEVGNSAEALESAFPDVTFTWLQFQSGGEGVFVLSRHELLAASTVFAQ